ncbi:MAG: ERAP1-like C-terminal domain-containing protein [Nocardioides sp.]
MGQPSRDGRGHRVRRGLDRLRQRPQELGLPAGPAPSTHPIAADNYDLQAVEVNSDGITYAKGASTLKQLVAWVGIDQFLAGLRDYFKAHQFGNSEFADLLKALEKASGRELDSWAEEGCRPRASTLAPEFELAEDGRYASFRVLQTAAADFPTLRRHRIGIGMYDVVDGRLTRRDSIELDVEGAGTDVPELLGQRQPDLLLLNDGDLTYAKIRLDDRSLATAIEHMHTVDDSLTRALVWGAAWDMTRDAEMLAGDFVELALRGLGTETDTTAVERLTWIGPLPGYVQTAIESYAHPARRPALRERWEAGLRRLLEQAAPGSDHQLAFLRGLASAATTEAGLDPHEALLDGRETAPGLDVDTDLRWVLLTGLVRAGRADESRIQAELALDNTISGQEHAAFAMAIRPTEEAKAQAWRDAIERDDLANETQRQVAYAFPLSGDVALMSPYLARYLQAADTIWEDKGTQRASTALGYMFPRQLASPEAIEAVDAWLATTSANPAAKRYVGEARADMARALAAHAKDTDLG